MDIAGVLIINGTTDLGNGLVSLTAPDREDGAVISIQRGGTEETRPKGSNGPFESFKLQGSLAQVNSLNEDKSPNRRVFAIFDLSR